MRLNWFSPLPPARTDIANFSARLLPSLARRAVVHAFASNPDPDFAAPGVTVSALDPKRMPWTEVNFREFSVYQLGNDVRFHGVLLDLLERHGGILVLHDGNLHETQRMRYVEQQRRPDRYLAALAAEGGDDAVEIGRKVLRGEVSVMDAAARYPLTQSVLLGAHGVVVHNQGLLEELRNKTNAPILSLPLCLDDPAQWPAAPERSLEAGEPLRMVLFGFLHGANRRVCEILSAWASFSQRERLQLTIFGEYDKAQLEGQLRELGLREQVELHPFLEEAAVARILDSAHLALNLRYPTRGEASGSLLRIWRHALPCFVTRSDYFASLDDSTVTFISPHREAEDLHEAWSRFLAKPAPFFAQGATGRARLERDHTPDRYAEQFIGFLETVARQRTGSYLERWLPQMAHEHLATIPDRFAQQHWRKRIAEEMQSWVPPTENSFATGE
jgi:hypothetical protein